MPRIPNRPSPPQAQSSRTEKQIDAKHPTQRPRIKDTTTRNPERSREAVNNVLYAVKRESPEFAPIHYQ
jgi:hypothetical protein